MGILIALFFIYGLLIGSFLNVCIYRLPRGISVAKGRSMCPSCSHCLSALDLVPVFSFLLLGRKCRYCKAPISWRYAAVELLTAFMFIGCYLRFQASLWQAILSCLFVSILIVIAFIDLDTGEVPDRLHIMLLILAVINIFLDSETSLLMKIIGFFAISVPMLLLTFLLNGFGGADIKLMAAAGLYLGTVSIALAFFIGAFFGAAVGISAAVKKHKSSKKTTIIDIKKIDGEHEQKLSIAFCPSLCAGIAISLFFSKEIIAFYLTFF